VGEPEHRIATAYVIERDGRIHEVFDPRYWAYHLGIKGVGASVDRRSIGIELASEGPVKRSGNSFTAFNRAYSGEVYDHGSTWRGQSQYWAAYPSSQLNAATELVDHLCSVFGVPRRSPRNHLDFDANLSGFKGVLGHHHLRADKSDPHPGFDWEGLRTKAGVEWV
jgi:N-acetyl-anhydromuramyl-L-alanine amidase AmpD